MTCSVRSKFYSIQFYCLVVVDSLDFKESFFDISLVKKLLVRQLTRDFDKILKHIVVYTFCWVSHVYLPLKICFFSEVRQTGAVVDMEVSDQQ